jgi:hypothetical protein
MQRVFVRGKPGAAGDANWALLLESQLPGAPCAQQRNFDPVISFTARRKA